MTILVTSFGGLFAVAARSLGERVVMSGGYDEQPSRLSALPASGSCGNRPAGKACQLVIVEQNGRTRAYDSGCHTL